MPSPALLQRLIEGRHAGAHCLLSGPQGAGEPQRGRAGVQYQIQQLRAVTVKSGTLKRAMIIAIRTARLPGTGHRRRKAVQGFSSHVRADAATALVREPSMTAGNLHDGRAGHSALPNEPRDVIADNGRRVQGFMSAVLTKGGVPKIWQASRPGVDTAKKTRTLNYRIR
jgi:IS5 family transposase